ncbi:pseudouridine synthase [Moraxella caviae]|uniref:Pseudouridine synthase n=1 Tax=Moraxella caviae TaxID=34060 RepID=A0A1T0A231_9GAMM|nr:pseudouridine synthase [Moraxella caviae]
MASGQVAKSQFAKNQSAKKPFAKNSSADKMSAPLSKPNAKKAQSASADEQISDFSRVNLLSVTPNQDGQRLDNFLLARLKGLPRSHVYKMIRDDEIRINGKRTKPHARLEVGDVVRVAPVRLASRQAPVISEQFAKGLMARIVYEDDGLIVLNKPYGMAVHGGSGESFGVIEALREAMGKSYLELIHRIDKDTSGLLLIAKKRSTLKALQAAFRERSISKSYLCLVHGHIKGERHLIDAPLYKYTLPSGERRVKVHKDGKPSQTQAKVLATFTLENRPASLVLASPLTGRTHQIRVHMAHLGHALLGDDKYQTNPNALPVKRLCLHAWQLHLPSEHSAQTDEQADAPVRPRRFVAALADDMQDLLPADVLAKIDE